MTGAGAQHGRSAQRLRQPLDQVGVEPGRRCPGLLVHVAAESGHLVGELGHQGAYGIGIGPAGVEPAGDQGRDGVDRSRPDGDLADRGQAAVPFGRRACGEADGGEADHRVPPVGQPGGAGVVGLTRDVEPPPAVRPDRRSHRDRRPEVDQSAALLDVQLDERADTGQRVGVRAEITRVSPGSAHGLGHRDSVGVDQRPGPVGVQPAGDHPRAGARHAEPGPFLIDEVDHADRPGRTEALLPQRVHRGERAGHAERPVERHRRPARCPGGNR